MRTTESADPGIDRRIADDLRDGIEPTLLKRFLWMIQVELVDKLVERHRKGAPISPSDRCNFGKRLRARHGSPRLNPTSPGSPERSRASAALRQRGAAHRQRIH